MTLHLSVIGAGLAGCEAAWQAANRGVAVDLYEMKPKRFSPAHTSPQLAELVCSNSLKAARVDSSAGLLKEEMRRFDSIIVTSADKCAVPAGGALAVDREAFSKLVTEAVKSHPNIHVIEAEVERIPEGPAIIATGPLTDGALYEDIERFFGSGYLSFYDAAAPIVAKDSIDFEKAFFASRYDKGTADYINLPMDKERYELFYESILNAKRAELHGFESGMPSVYEGCMPIEVLASRGKDAMRYGPMKPVGLRDPKTGHRPWAVVQLRTENAAGTMYNLVGFQTNLTFPEQKRVFGLIPGLENANFLRYGVMHRNTFLDSPRLLNPTFAAKKRPNLFFAGQISGVEGYIESASSGLVAGINAARLILGEDEFLPPDTSMVGALCRYVGDGSVKHFQPMGANMGILPELEKKIRDKREKYKALAERALADIDGMR